MFSMSKHTVSHRHHSCHCCAPLLHRAAQAQLHWHNCHHTKPLLSPTLLHQFHRQIPVTVTAYLPSIHCHTSLNVLTVTATNVTLTSKICASVILLLTAVHWVIKHWSILQWYNIDIKFCENRWNYKKFKMECMGHAIAGAHGHWPLKMSTPTARPRGICGVLALG
jgi:hypothetical protein